MNNISPSPKERVKRFYDEIGWKKTNQQLFVDTYRFEDTRLVSAEYRHKCHLRINKYLSHNGKYLLDIACGPIQFPEYVDYSEGYKFRICADISINALKEAKKVEEEHGLYVLCDITHMPFASDSIDNVISLHTIYHVPEKEQLSAFIDIKRVLSPTGQAAIVYTWARYSIPNIIAFPYRTWTLACRLFERIRNRLFKSNSPQEPKLYFYFHTYDWFLHQLKPIVDYELDVWRSLSINFLKMYIHEFTFGRAILKWIFKIEERYPHLAAKYGAFPIFVIKK